MAQVSDVRTKTLDAAKYNIVIPDEVYQKIFHWINKSDFEVSGFGSVEFDEKNNIFTVTDAILLKQKNGPTSTDIPAEAMGKAMFRMKDKPNGLKWHWHSHVNMNCFWSGDDMEIIRSLGYQGWIIATVFNKKREYRSAFMTTTEVMGKKQEYFVDQITTEVLRFIHPDAIKSWDKEYDDNVTELGGKYNMDMFEQYGVDTTRYIQHGLDTTRYTQQPLDIHSQPVTTVNDSENWDESGYRWSDREKEWFYSPLQDKEILEDEKIEYIKDLTRKEFSDLCIEDPDVIDFCFQHNIREDIWVQNT